MQMHCERDFKKYYKIYYMRNIEESIYVLAFFFFFREEKTELISEASEELESLKEQLGKFRHEVS